jgi:hypothetical protein
MAKESTIVDMRTRPPLETWVTKAQFRPGGAHGFGRLAAPSPADEFSGRTTCFAPSLDQPRELRTRIAAHAPQKAQHHAFIGAAQPSVAKAAQGAGNKIVALIGAHRKTDCHGAIEKGPQLVQRMQLCVVPIDHHASHHDRSQLPVQAHFALETPRFRLILYCKRLGLDLAHRGMHHLPQRPLRSAPAVRIGRWSTREQPRSRAIGHTEHRSGITAALHRQRGRRRRAH